MKVLLPLTSRRGIDIRRNADALIHGHIGERFTQDAIVNGACPIQTFVPVTRLSASLEMEEQELAAAEAAALERLPQVIMEGEEIFLPYAFVPASHESRRVKPTKPATTNQYL